MAGKDQQLDDLLYSIGNGDQNALATLYHETSSSVYAFALSILKNAHNAEDVLQDCFISIHENASQYRSSGKPMAWIMTIAKNLCLMQLRRQGKTEPLDETWDQPVSWREDATVTDRIVLRQCMQRLTDQERQIVVLHAVAGFKHREISQLLDMNLATVLSKYHRAIRKLRESLS